MKYLVVLGKHVGEILKVGLSCRKFDHSVVVVGKLLFLFPHHIHLGLDLVLNVQTLPSPPFWAVQVDLFDFFTLIVKTFVLDF
jgi:hypothetical protein